MSHRRPAFSLIELLVSIAIIAMLLAVLLPSLSKARLAGKRAACFSNMRQITAAVLMYGHDNADDLPITMELVSTGLPVTVSWWAVQNYQNALHRYIQMDRGGIDAEGKSRGKRTVWFDPADPESENPVMWGSFISNGLVTGVPRKLGRIPTPSDTVYSTLREKNWADTTGIPVPDPIPVTGTSDPFWSSVYFDMCLDPWSADTDPANPFHWSTGRAVPPESLWPAHPEAGPWDIVVDGRNSALVGNRPRYGDGVPTAYCDGHVEQMRFEDTYKGPDGNQWDIR